MRISTRGMKSIAFVCEDRIDNDSEISGSRKRTPVATAFFVEVPCEQDRSVIFDYLITTRHTIEKTDKDCLYVRINKKEQLGFIDYPTRRNDWYPHENADVSAALATFSNADELDIYKIPIDNFVSGIPEQTHNDPAKVTLGDEVYACGLFTQHHGKERGLPVARFGEIARLPDLVDIPIDDYGNFREITAYLVEFLSWGGVSGSPVWWIPKYLAGQGPVMYVGFPQSVLLGMVSGHFSIPQKADVRGDVLGEVRTKLNSGIAFVTPAEAIRELLMRRDFAEERIERFQKIRRQMLDPISLDG